MAASASGPRRLDPRRAQLRTAESPPLAVLRVLPCVLFAHAYCATHLCPDMPQTCPSATQTTQIMGDLPSMTPGGAASVCRCSESACRRIADDMPEHSGKV